MSSIHDYVGWQKTKRASLMETHCQVGLLEHAERHQKAMACAVMAAPSETYSVSH
jgi:hypothetical protein